MKIGLDFYTPAKCRSCIFNCQHFTKFTALSWEQIDLLNKQVQQRGKSVSLKWSAVSL